MISEKVSILIPVYNMQSSITSHIDKAMTIFPAFLNDFELILSNDGSADNTLEELSTLEEKYKGIIKVASVSVNQGKGHALKRAFEKASGEYIAFCDADMELNPAQLENFFSIMKEENADIVIGSKRHPKSQINYSFTRKIISALYFYFVKVFFRLPIKDTQTGLKLFKRDVLTRLFPRVIVKAFAYDLEILSSAHRAGYKIAEAPINLLAIRNFGVIAFKVLWQTFKDTLAVFYRLIILRYYDNLFNETDYKPLVSIIIPLKAENDYILQTSLSLKKQTYQNYELIILPDEEGGFTNEAFNDGKTRIIKTGPIAPAHKRHLGAKEANGEILSFLDDDTYAEIDWLANAIRAFDFTKVSVLGGPAVNAPDDNFFQKVSGLVYSSVLVSGNYSYRYIVGPVCEVNDYPSCNLLVRKNTYFEAGGFDSTYWPGEDTIFCQNLIDNGEKILYSPEVLVYHHRRHIFKGHFKQLSSYAWHRGYFVRHLGGNSLSLSYFIPSLLLIYEISLPLLFFVPLPLLAKTLYLAPFAFYLFCVFVSSTVTMSVPYGFMKGLGIILSHASYGFNFIRGLLSPWREKNE